MMHLLNNRPNAVFLDIGANAGTYSIFMSKLCEAVHAFEPNERTAKKLRTNIEINHTKNIFIHNVGLGEKTRKLNLLVPLEGSTGWSSFVLGDPQKTKGIEVDVVAGDEMMKKLNLNKIDLIKIDVEGFEKNVLVGLRETIKKYCPIIFMEFTDFTKNNFSGIGEWDSIFSRYRIFNFIENIPFFIFFNRSSYKLTEFDFSAAKGCGNILCLPE